MASRESKFPMLPVEEALEKVLSLSVNRTHESVTLVKSIHRTIAKDALSPADLPSFPASMKDGYCISLDSDTDTNGRTYQILDTILAGRDISEFPQTIESNQAYKIMTGAPIPSSCNTVIMIEDTILQSKYENGQEQSITITKSISQGRDVRGVGSDIKLGDVIMKKGETIGPAELGLLASCGLSEIDVFSKPIIGIMSTGDEVIDSFTNQSLQPGQIYDANRPLLQGLLSSYSNCIEIIDFGIIPDSENKLFPALEEAIDKIDILITSGGVSMGEVDLVKK